MTQRIVNGGQPYNLAYDAENHMTTVSGAASASFVYNGDGQRVIATENGMTTIFIGNYAEWTVNSGEMKRYYFAGATRLAVRTNNGQPQWLLGDHLGSTSKAVNYDGSTHSEQGYRAFGESRFVVGSLPTKYQFTGQYRDSYIGLDYFNARWYDGSLGRFNQPDTMIPEQSNVLDWDRYSFVRSNPLRYSDPTGHQPACNDTDDPACDPATSRMTPRQLWLARAKELGVTFGGSMRDWTVWRMMVVVLAALDVGRAFAKILPNTTAISAFKSVFKNGIQINWGMEGASDRCSPFTHGCTSSATQINFKNLNGEGRRGYDSSGALLAATNNVVHELGHAFSKVLNETPALTAKGGYKGIDLTTSGGYANTGPTEDAWTPNTGDTPSEHFANMFLGWVYDEWGRDDLGRTRAQFMADNMPTWVQIAAAK